MSKKCKKCGKLNENILYKLCRSCTYEDSYNNPKQLKIYSINKVSKKKKQRIKEGGSEIDVFKEIWNEREHECQVCGKSLNEGRIYNFDHEIPKSKGEKYRLDKNNIIIKCFSCHFEKTTGLKYKGINYD